MTSSGASNIRYTSYTSSPGVSDPVFFYCNVTGLERGSLSASRPGKTGLFNFKWFKWSDATTSFSIPAGTENGVSSSTVNNLQEGGYKVDIDIAGVYDTSLVGWIFFDRKPVVEAKLSNPLKNCYYVGLSGSYSYTVNTFYYKDIVTGASIGMPNEKTFLWSSTPASTIPYPNSELNPITYVPPLEDVTYKLTVNSLGCTNESSFFYESIHVKADFTLDPDKGEAPLEVAFTDKSVRGATYLWEFGDDSTSSLNEPLPHIYYRPGEYSVKLTVESEQHCVDSLRFDFVEVDPSKLEIPNVFTPDGDGINDFFLVNSTSLRTLNVEIYSRSGLLVYSFSGEGQRLAEWPGWDGNINNSSRKATPGVYFYIIRGQGWDDILYDNKSYRGFFYLYR
jgi:gliding motility-associated-like protein